eukprot:SAG11_NODE_8239_length_1042_cov_1.460233_2_plen_139_part_00
MRAQNLALIAVARACAVRLSQGPLLASAVIGVACCGAAALRGRQPNFCNEVATYASETHITSDAEVCEPQHGAAAADVATGLEAAADELASLVTIVVNTSPIQLHPSTILIEEVLEALILNVPSLRHCPKLIICDWVR